VSWRRGSPWRRRFVALAVVDTLVLGAALVVYLGAGSPTLTQPPRTSPPVIGVMIDDAVGGGAVVEPREGSPAERAGLRVGDVVVAVDDAPVDDADALSRAVREGPLAPRRVRVRRDGAMQTFVVEPERGTHRGTLRPGRRGLFAPLEPQAEPRCFELDVAAPSPTALTFFALALGCALGLAAAARRVKVPSVGFWLGFGSVFALASLAAMVARSLACVLFGGHGPGGLLLALITQGVVLVLGARVLSARQPRVGPLLTPLPRGRVYAQSMFYALVGLPRAAVVAFALHGAVAALARLQTGTPIDAFAEAELGVLGSALLLLGGAVLAPYAEELLFRGALFSHLARFLSPWGTVLASASLFGLLHVHHGVSIAGPLVMGVVLGWARATTGGLLVPFALHATFNTASLLAGVILR
jgi:membrane protease YdiL (CAAX protease family)